MIQEQMAQIVGTARSSQRESVIALSEESRDKGLAIRIADDLHERLLGGIAESPELQQVKCCAGCNYCCFQPVDVTTPQAIAIAQYLNNRCGEQQLSRLKVRLEKLESQIRDMTRAEHTKTLIRCGFLDHEGQCSVYESRPLGCAGFLSKSVRACKQTYENPSDLTLSAPRDLHVLLWASGLSEGLREGLFAARLDPSNYELHSAVLFALLNPDAATEWSAGKRALRSCINRESDTISEADMRELNPAPRSRNTRVGRNEPCPCGSGKKHKKCCVNFPSFCGRGVRVG